MGVPAVPIELIDKNLLLVVGSIRNVHLCVKNIMISNTAD